MKTLLALAITVFAASAFAADSGKEISDVKKLRAELAEVQGVAIRLGGIDTNDALRKLADAIITLDRRLSTIEGKK